MGGALEAIYMAAESVPGHSGAENKKRITGGSWISKVSLANSPDPNPVENDWASPNRALGERLSKAERRPHTVAKLLLFISTFIYFLIELISFFFRGKFRGSLWWCHCQRLYRNLSDTTAQ